MKNLCLYKQEYKKVVKNLDFFFTVHSVRGGRWRKCDADQSLFKLTKNQQSRTSVH
jgi:hypothetical protein